MTNHLHEQDGVEILQDNSQPLADTQSEEINPAVLNQAEDILLESTEIPVAEVNVESKHPIADSGGEVPDTVTADDFPETLSDAIEATVHKDNVDTEEIIHGEELNEKLDATKKTGVDYANFTRKEIVERLRQLLDNGNIDAVREEIDVFKLQFYRKLKAEQELKRAEYIENGGAEEDYVSEEDEQESILKAQINRYREIRHVQNEQIGAEKQKNLEEKLKIIENLKELAKGSESLGGTFQMFRTLQNRWRSVGPVPQTEVKNLWDTYHHYVELFYDYIKLNRELRDLDFKRNLEAKIELCEKAESLLLEPSVVKAFHTLQTFHEQWREIGPVPQEMRVDIWDRFKTASMQINKKHQEHFDNLKVTQQKNKETKEALCDKIEEILNRPMNSSIQVRKNAQEIVEIQKLWNTVGYANKKDNNILFKRFHTLCDRFFNQKREFTDHEKEEYNTNLQLKQDLCVQAEALKDSIEWKSTTEEFILLQNKWREIGSVSLKHREVIWKRFRKACDYFFEQKANYYSATDSEYENNLKAKRELIDQIRNFEQSKKSGESFERLKEFQRKWSEIGFVPITHKKKIQDEYRDAIDKQFEALRLDDGERNRLYYKSKVEIIASTPKSRGKLGTERDKLIRKYQQLQSDLIVWENNIGFFSKSKKSEAMIASVQRMIEQGKAEIKELEEKIIIINSVEDGK